MPTVVRTRRGTTKKTILPRPKPGLLKGYSATMIANARHRALMRVLHSTGETPLSIGRHLLLLSTLTKSRAPRASRVFKKNSNWMFKKSKPKKPSCGCSMKPH